MQQVSTKLWVRFVPLSLVLMLVIAACTSTSPSVDLTADSETPDLGQTVTLTATPSDFEGTNITYGFTLTPPTGSAATISESGATATFTPDVDGVYTVSVTAESGSESASDSITIDPVDGGGNGEPTGGTGGPPTGGPGGDDTAAPTLTFTGVSTSADGTFSSDATSNINDDDDDRVIDVAAGGSFFARVEASDPSGVDEINILLVNSSPDGISGTLSTDADTAGFTLAGDPTAPTGETCDLDGDNEDVVCIYEIDVADGTEPIEDLDGAGNEFAYVFRVTATDGEDNTAGGPGELSARGYVDITAAASAAE